MENIDKLAREMAENGGPFSTKRQNYEYFFKLGYEYLKKDLEKAFEAGHDSARKATSYKSNGTYQEDLNNYLRGINDKNIG